MSAFDAQVLADQLARLGRDLQDYVTVLGDLEERAVDHEGDYRRLDAEYEDAFAHALLASEGSVEMRKAHARLKSVPARLITQDAWLEWNKCKARLRTQQASLSALHKRIEIGRSLLSREKALLSLGGIGEV